MLTDALHSLRALARTPLMATVVVLSLGTGIGVNTVVFSWIQALTLRPLPGVADASRFHLIEPVTEAALRPGASWREYQDLAGELRSMDDLIAFRMTPLNVGVPPETQRASALLVSGNYFSALRLQPAVGRLVQPDEAVAVGRSPVVVISYDYWRAHFGAAADAVGRTIRVNDVDLTIIGVAPERFQGTVLGLQFDMWLPATMAPVVLTGSRELEERGMRGYYVMGSLAAGVSLADAQADAAAVMQRLAQQFPESNGAIGAQVLPFWRAGRGPQGMLLQGLAVLQGVLLVLLLAVCGNTANLVLARASTRLREVGVRLALGAGAWRVARLLLVESLLLGLASAFVGAVIAYWGTNALRAVPVLSTQFPVRFQTDLDGQTLAFAILLGVLAALLFGAAPALQMARLSPQFVLRAGTGLTARGGVRTAIMAVEVALAAVVLVVAALFFKSFQQTQEMDPGFRSRGVLLASYELPRERVNREQTLQFGDRVLARLRSLPDVESAALAVAVPLDIHGLPSRTFVLEGRPRVDGAQDRALSNTVSPGYFATMGIPFVGGADFAALSDTAAPAQAIVNEEFVRRYVGEGPALGRRVTVGTTEHVVVGVVRTSLNESFTEPPTPVIYLSFRDRPSPFAEMHVRTRLGDEMMAAPGVRQAIRDLDSTLPVFNVRTLSQHVEMNLVLRRIPAQMFMVLGPLMLVLAAVGIYAVVAYSVSHRTSEIGVRMALGAGRAVVIRQIISENMRVVMGGAMVGWGVVAYVYTRFMRGEIDLFAFVLIPALLLGVAAAACWFPARRASRIDPIVALRAE
jgi:predicted permease